jgi:hypothetical protein
MSVSSPVTDKVRWSRNVDISGANLPLEFWLVILTVPVITVFGTCLAVRYRQYIWAIWGRGAWDHPAQGIPVSQSIFRSAGYLLDLPLGLSQVLHTSTAGNWTRRSDVMRPLVNFCLVSALPFGVLAYSDKTWRSSDASICLGAWIVVCASFWPK